MATSSFWSNDVNSIAQELRSSGNGLSTAEAKYIPGCVGLNSNQTK